MRAEIDSLHQHNAWDLVELPEGYKPVGSKWVFKVKTNVDGSTDREIQGPSSSLRLRRT